MTIDGDLRGKSITATATRFTNVVLGPADLVAEYYETSEISPPHIVD